jgi:hypothetical protein
MCLHFLLNFQPSDDVVSDEDIAEAKGMHFLELHKTKIDAGLHSVAPLDTLDSKLFGDNFTIFTLFVHARAMTAGPDTLIQRVVPEWKCRERFSKCFTELDFVGRDKGFFLLKDLSDALDSEVAHNDRQFEAFGVKFPTEDLSRWVIVLVLAILLYFYVTLRELSPKIKSTDPGLEVAWIGLYPSWFACLLLWTSALVVPGVAVITLGLTGARYQGPLSVAVRTNLWNICLWIALPGVSCCVLAAFSCLAARRLALIAASARKRGNRVRRMKYRE